ncbi:Homeobox-leucine zipper protein MERISTEM L1 [Orobanche gracilis]
MFFKDCPHPDNKQRIELSQDLEMDPLQVKFWFQNKRTQMKMKHERQQNTNLRAENEKLLAENTRFRDALSNASCPACGRMANIADVSLDERYLRMENARLRDEINHISGVAANYVGKPITKSTDTPSSRVLHLVNLGMGPVFRGSPSKGKGVDDSHDNLKNNTP